MVVMMSMAVRMAMTVMMPMTEMIPMTGVMIKAVMMRYEAIAIMSTDVWDFTSRCSAIDVHGMMGRYESGSQNHVEGYGMVSI